MKVLVAGDYCEKYRVADAIKSGEYARIFSEVKPVIESADYSIVNFEFPIVVNDGHPISKCGPNLQGSKKSVDAIKYAGFKCCTLANNHILDQGEQCGIDTQKNIEQSGLDTVGFGCNKNDAAKVLYKVIYGQTLAIINCCEHEFSVASEASAGANGLNPIQQFYSIKEAKERADYILVIVHGGHEHYQLPSPRMQELYRYFIDLGADAVVNHHQHCFSGYEIYKERPIFYGIGNFCFDNNKDEVSPWNEGYLVNINFKKEITFEIIPYVQCCGGNFVSLITKDKKETFKNALQNLNILIQDELKLRNLHNSWMQGSSENFQLLCSPYTNRFLIGLVDRKILPMRLSKKKNLMLYNCINCEAHRDRFLYMLKSLI